MRKSFRNVWSYCNLVYNFDFLLITLLSPSYIVNVWKRYRDSKKRLVDTTILLQSLRAKTSSLKYNVLKMAVFITYTLILCGMRCVLSKPGCGPLWKPNLNIRVRDANYHSQINILTYKSSQLVWGFVAFEKKRMFRTPFEHCSTSTF